jgi:hypothetical protein
MTQISKSLCDTIALSRSINSFEKFRIKLHLAPPLDSHACFKFISPNNLQCHSIIVENFPFFLFYAKSCCDSSIKRCHDVTRKHKILSTRCEDSQNNSQMYSLRKRLFSLSFVVYENVMKEKMLRCEKHSQFNL